MNNNSEPEELQIPAEHWRMLDVFDVEPLPAEHPFRGMANVVLTGHTGYVVKELYAKAYGDAIEDVAAWRAGTPIRVLE